MATHYFATDGSYGDATGLVLINTDNWTPSHWRTIEEASDYEERAEVAKRIAEIMADEDESGDFTCIKCNKKRTYDEGSGDCEVCAECCTCPDDAYETGNYCHPYK